ncbi:hypothetical protein AB7M38_007313 [Bradyrhizobium diazoefficiens]
MSSEPLVPAAGKAIGSARPKLKGFPSLEYPPN